MLVIRIPIPRLPHGLGPNLLGVAGVIGLAVALGGLFGSPWVTLLVLSAAAIAIAYVAGTHNAAEPAATEPAAARPAVAARAERKAA